VTIRGRDTDFRWDRLTCAESDGLVGRADPESKLVTRGTGRINASGELAAYAAEAAKAVGASEQAAIIQSANAFFGNGGPSADRKKRMDQLSKVYHDALEKLTTRYYACPEPLRELLPEFVAKNPESFKLKK